MNRSSVDVQRLPRGIPWARWLGIALVIMLVLAVGIYWWVQSYVTITVATDTTYLTAPLMADGYPDYLGHMNAQNSAGVTPENNAWVAVIRCVGPREIKEERRPDYFRLLGIAPLPEEGNYLYEFYDSRRLETLPEEVLIASSVAAQMPYHVRFARLAALNVDKRATEIEQYGFTSPAPEYFDLQEWIANITSGIAQRIELTILEPDAAAELSRVESTPEWDSSLTSDPDQIQDLRAEALDSIKPQYLDAEGVAQWRREQFQETGKKLIEREDMIMSERPWTDAECPLGADWVRRSTPLLDELQRELAQRPNYYAPLVDDSGKQFLLNVALDSIQSLRKCALAYSSRSRYYLHRNDRAAALRDIQAIFALARCYPQQPILVESLVAYAIHGIALPALAEWLLHPGVTDDELQQVAEFLAAIPPLPQLAPTLATERLFAVGSIVSIIAREDGSLDPKNNYWETTIVCWDEVLREMNRMYDTLEAAAKPGTAASNTQALAQAFPPRPDLDELYKQRPWYLLPSQRTEVVKYYYTRMFEPSLRAVLIALRKAQVRHDLARVYVALARFRRTQNAYPAAITELVPRYLTAVPLDPFDGQPLKYQRMPTGGYRAWSIWSNGVDDGGTPNVGDDDPDFHGNDLVIGSPDEIQQKYLLAW